MSTPMVSITEERLRLTHRAYMGCALWSSPDYDADGDASDNLDALYTVDDIAPEARDAMLDDVVGFLSLCEREGVDLSQLDPEQIGHDLWLTRNGHGAGFWDRGLGELGDRLTDLAHTFGECDLYVGDDGQVWAS